MRKTMINTMARLLASSVALTLLLTTSVHAEDAKECPNLVPTQQVQMEISSIRFTDLVIGQDGNSMEMDEEDRESYKTAVVTIKIKKPAGKEVSLAAADLTLHYYYSSESEVAPCEGMSTFTQIKDAVRPIDLPQFAGPGWVKQETDEDCTQAEEVYFDAVFDMIEPDIREVWLCVGQPVATAPYLSVGW